MVRWKLAIALVAAGAPLVAAQPVRARHGMVVAREVHATRAGVQILQAGGNAVDAAVAVGFALAVTHLSAGNLGGGGFMLLRMADGRTAFLDFRESAPAAASRNMYLDAAGKATEESMTGYRASGVPGTVRGLEYAAKHYGRKPWAELMKPALDLASGGFTLSWAQAESLRTAAPGLSRFPESNRIFLRNGRYYEPASAWCSRNSRGRSNAFRARAPTISTREKRRVCWPRICGSTAAPSPRPILKTTA